MNRPYLFNPLCRCAWCAAGGNPVGGYWTSSPYGRVYVSNDSYGEPHSPPTVLKAVPMEVKS